MTSAQPSCDIARVRIARNKGMRCLQSRRGTGPDGCRLVDSSLVRCTHTRVQGATGVPLHGPLCTAVGVIMCIFIMCIFGDVLPPPFSMRDVLQASPTFTAHLEFLYMFQCVSVAHRVCISLGLRLPHSRQEARLSMAALQRSARSLHDHMVWG